MSETAIIKTRDLCFYYADNKVLHNVNLDFQKHHITSIIGPSGCGKSTLLRCLNRIYSLYPKLRATGQIIFNNENILDQDHDLLKLRREIGMVFQKPTPFPMSIFDNIAFALRLHFKNTKSEIEGRVETALRQAALWDEVKDKLFDGGTHLSGGQQQRLCIARAISVQPELLLLDEPTSALDPIATAKVEELITSLREHYHIIMVTHNLKQAQRISDETLFLRDGKVIEFAATKQIFSNPSDPQTKAYIETY
jgi:phosphate transport system ATP-binding protein